MSSESFNQEHSVGLDASDEALIEAVQTGDVGALREIYRRYVRLVYTLALRILDCAEEAEDITQDIFLALWRERHYDSSRGSLQRFLVMLTRSRSIDRMRSQKSRHRRHQRLEIMEEDKSALNQPLDQISLREQAEQVRKALSTLSSSEQEVLEIAYYEGLSQSAISARLGIPLGTVKTRSRQGLKKLRLALDDSIWLGDYEPR